jgi:hypothetical protein
MYTNGMHDIYIDDALCVCVCARARAGGACAGACVCVCVSAGVRVGGAQVIERLRNHGQFPNVLYMHTCS